MQLGEINVIGTDLARMRAFYCGLLGFEPVEQEGPVALHCRLGGGNVVELLQGARGAVPDASG